MNAFKNLLPGWGTEAEISFEQVVENADFWRSKLYERKLLVFRGWKELTISQLWKLHRVFGAPWTKPEYDLSREHGLEFEPGSSGAYTKYGNTSSAARIGDRQMPWHRDIPWHRELKYPIRSLTPIALENQNTPTQFVDADVLTKRLPDNRLIHLHFMELEIVNWYQVVENNPIPDVKTIPLMDEHPVTKKMVPMLNSFLKKNSTQTFGARREGAWIHNVLSYSTPVGVDHMQEFHELVCTEDNIYSHDWRTGDVVLFDNHSGIMHRRDAIEPVDPEKPIVREFLRYNVKHETNCK